MPTPADGARNEAAVAVRRELRELTANLMRVTRGAGRPELILPQTTALAAAFAAYRDVCGEAVPVEDLARALALEVLPDDEFDEIWPDWDRAVREMVRGALQVAAAELLAQEAQAAAGRRELFGGFRHLEKLHADQLGRLRHRRRGDAGNENA